MLTKKIYNLWYRKFPPEMVSYWITKQMCRARVTTDEEGRYIMHFEGEKYPFPGFPRGHLLFGSLSPLKHQIKNKIFNDTWAKLEENVPHDEIMRHFRTKTWPEITELYEKSKYFVLPIEKCALPVQEIHRAMTVVAKKHDSRATEALRDILCFILQEDDGYRFRVQWLAGVFAPKSWIRRLFNRSLLDDFDSAFRLMVHAETIGDMRERINLLRTVLGVFLKDEHMRRLFQDFVDETDWTKLELTKADRYFFRAKYFRVDYDKGYEY